MATISFAADDQGIQNLNGSGLGFFGEGGFGRSVNVGEYNDATFITNANGLTEGPQVNNVKFVHPASGSINGLDAVNLLDIPNYLATLKITFSHTSAVKTQNAEFRAYDRNNINNNPSGVVVRAAEIIHPSTTQTGQTGSGDASWISIAGSGTVLEMVSSPGVSGERPNGSDTEEDQHDWYVSVSCSPNSTGSKTYAGYFSVEYL